MIAPRWRKVIRDLVGHAFRTLLVVVSIAVGVFAIAVVMGARGVLLREFAVDHAASNPPAIEFTVTDTDESLVRALEREPAVRAAEGIRSFALKYTPGLPSAARKNADGTVSSAGWETLRVSAVPDFERLEVGTLLPETTGSWAPGPGEIVIERGATQIADFAVGQVITVETSENEFVPLRIVGFVHDINALPARFVGSITGFVSTDSLAELGESDGLNHISITLKDRTLDRSAVDREADRLRARVIEPAGTVVLHSRVPKPGSHFLGDIFKAVSLLLLAMGVMALALSAFLVVNTISAIMAQHVRQVGIMKAIGGRSDQISRMYLTMVVAYGIMAVAIGVPAGLAMGHWFIEYAAGILNFRIGSYAPPWYVIALEILVGVAVPVFAAAFPVRAGATMPVVRALNTTGMSTAGFGSGLIDRALGLVRGLPRPIALSLRNTFLRKGRLALTLTTLTLASAVVISVVSVRGSMLRTVDDIGAWWAYDASLGFERPKPAETVEREAAKVEGVERVETWLEIPAAIHRNDGTKNEDVYAVGLPPDTEFIAPRLVSGRWLEVGDRDAVVVNTDIANDIPAARPGSRITMTINGEEHEWHVVGIVAGQLRGGSAFCDRSYLDGLTGAGGMVTTLLAISKEHDPASQREVATRLEQALDDAGLRATGSDTESAMTSRVGSQFAILVFFLVVMASLLAAVGVIGLTGTMTINVLESTREIGVMRSIGASHGSIFGIFVAEGVVVALLSWGAGAIVAWPMSMLLTSSLATAMGVPLTYMFSFGGVGVWLVLMLAIAAFASITPAYRAAQVSVRDAIAYE